MEESARAAEPEPDQRPGRHYGTLTVALDIPSGEERLVCSQCGSMGFELTGFCLAEPEEPTDPFGLERDEQTPVREAPTR